MDPLHLDLNEPEKNDIIDAANEMLEQMEMLRKIAGKDKEEKLSDEVIPSDKEAKETPEPSRSSHQKGKQSKSPTISSMTVPDKGSYHFQISLPKEYAGKCKLLHLCPNVNLNALVSKAVIEIIDNAWEENVETVQKYLKTIIK